MGDKMFGDWIFDWRLRGGASPFVSRSWRRCATVPTPWLFLTASPAQTKLFPIQTLCCCLLRVGAQSPDYQLSGGWGTVQSLRLGVFSGKSEGSLPTSLVDPQEALSFPGAGLG